MAIRLIQITDEAISKYKDASIDDALLQAIFNGIDADASEVRVTALSRKGDVLDLGDENEVISEIQISDNGTGIPYDKIGVVFEPLERSWKKGSKPKDRASYHGEKGCGRFKCFALGAELRWHTVFRGEDGQLYEYSMQLDVSAAKNLEVDEKPVKSPKNQTGTVLSIKLLTNKFYKQFSKIEGLRLDVLIGLILDIEVYKKVIWVFGKQLDPNPIKADEETFNFTYETSESQMANGTVRVLAWKDEAQFVGHKHSFYYRPDGRFLAKRPSGFFADTHYPAHTLIIQAEGLEHYSDLEADFGPFARIEKAIRAKVIRFLVKVKHDSFSEILGQLYENEAYPFKSLPHTAIEEAKVTAFNAVLGALAFDNPNVVSPKKKAVLKMLFPLLDRLVSGDSLLSGNIDQLLALDQVHSSRFNRVFPRIKLSNIIDRYNRLQHRYAFLETLNKLVHVAEYSDVLLERTQLHKIVEQEVWIFGPEYEQRNLIVSDKSLVTLLREQITRTDIFLDLSSDQEKLADIETFIERNRTDIEQCLNKIPDLVLAKSIKMNMSDNAIQYLVIELKRPTVKINKECHKQALDVFNGVLSGTKGGGLKIDTTHRWRYCLISSDIDDELIPEFGEDQRLDTKMGGNYVIDVLTWASIIENARQRLDEEMKGIEVEVADSDCQELLQEYAELFKLKSINHA